MTKQAIEETDLLKALRKVAADYKGGGATERTIGQALERLADEYVAQMTATVFGER